MQVFPVPGRLVRDPQTRKVLPAAGRDVPDHSPFWLRRLRDGDVSHAAAVAEPAAAEPAAEPAAEAATAEGSKP